MIRDRGEAPFISGPERRGPAPETSVLAQYLFYVVIVALMTLAGWLYLSTTVRVDAEAVEIYNLEQRKEELRREIVQRGAELAQLESLDRIRSEAERMGFRARSAGQQLVVPQTMAVQADGEQAAPSASGVSLWQRLTQFLSKGQSEPTR